MTINTNIKRWAVIPAALGAMLLFGAESCESESNPGVDSDSQQSYESGSKIPTDTEIYRVTGTVVGDVNSLTRQQAPAKGETSGSCYGNGYCSMSGSYFGPVESGKGYVRIAVEEATPGTELAQVGRISILKVTDTKATALLPGDRVTFKCRRQYEAIAAVKDNQKFDSKDVQSWELDYCRMESAVITPGETKLNSTPLP